MQLIQTLLYLAAVVLLVIAAFPNRSRVNLAVLGAAAFVLAYSLPSITATL